MADWIGYRWLAERYGVQPVQAFRTDSVIAKSRATLREDGHVHEFHPPGARPADTLAGHLTFALKHEGVHLEFLARLFDVAAVADLEAWVAAKLTRLIRTLGEVLDLSAGEKRPTQDIAGDLARARIAAA